MQTIVSQNFESFGKLAYSIISRILSFIGLQCPFSIFQCPSVTLSCIGHQFPKGHLCSSTLPAACRCYMKPTSLRCSSLPRISTTFSIVSIKPWLLILSCVSCPNCFLYFATQLFFLYSSLLLNHLLENENMTICEYYEFCIVHGEKLCLCVNLLSL